MAAIGTTTPTATLPEELRPPLPLPPPETGVGLCVEEVVEEGGSGVPIVVEVTTTTDVSAGGTLVPEGEEVGAGAADVCWVVVVVVVTVGTDWDGVWLGVGLGDDEGADEGGGADGDEAGGGAELDDGGGAALLDECEGSGVLLGSGDDVGVDWPALLGSLPVLADGRELASPVACLTAMPLRTSRT